MASLPAPAEIRKAFSLPGLFDASCHSLGDGCIDVFGLMTVSGRPVQVCVSASHQDSSHRAPADDIRVEWWPVCRRDRSDESVMRIGAGLPGAIARRLAEISWLPSVLGRGRRPVRNWTFGMMRLDGSIPSDLLQAASGPHDLDIRVELRANCGLKCRFCMNSSPAYSRREQDDDLVLVADLVEHVVLPARAAGVSTVLRFDADDVTAHRHLIEIMGLVHESCGCPIHLIVPAVRLASPAVVDSMAGLPGLFKLTTSVFGASALTHDGVAGIPGAFAGAVRAIRNLSTFPLWVQCHLVVTRDAVGEIGAVVDMLAHFGIDVMVQGLLADCPGHEPILRGILPDLESLRSSFEEAGGRILGAARLVGVEIADFPTCAVPRGLRGLAVVHHPRPELYRYVLTDLCGPCAHSADCIGVSEVYIDVHGHSGINPEIG